MFCCHHSRWVYDVRLFLVEITSRTEVSCDLAGAWHSSDPVRSVLDLKERQMDQRWQKAWPKTRYWVIRIRMTTCECREFKPSLLMHQENRLQTSHVPYISHNGDNETSCSDLGDNQPSRRNEAFSSVNKQLRENANHPLLSWHTHIWSHLINCIRKTHCLVSCVFQIGAESFQGSSMFQVSKAEASFFTVKKTLPFLNSMVKLSGIPVSKEGVHNCCNQMISKWVHCVGQMAYYCCTWRIWYLRSLYITLTAL